MKQKRIWIASIVSLMVLVLSACGGTAETPSGNQESAKESRNESSQGTDLPTIKVGMVCGGMTPLIAQIGINDGSFKEAGINAEEVCFKSGSDAVKALAGGGINVNLGSYEHVLKFVQSGLGVKAYGELYNGIGYSLVVKKDSEYESLSDLKGTTLAVTRPGSMSDTGLREGLEKEGVDPENDVKIIGGGSGSTMLAAIESGKVAGGMVSEPTLSQMIATGDYRVLYEPDFDYAGIVVMGKSDWINKNKETMKTFMKTLTEINERAQKNPEEAAQTMQEDFKNIEPDVLSSAVKNQLTKAPEGLKVTKAGTEKVTEIAVDLNIIDEPIPHKKAVDLSFLP